MKAVLFDLFGTLVDNPTNAIVDRHRSAIALAIGVDPIEFSKGWKMTFHERVTGSLRTSEEIILAAAFHCSSSYSPSGIPQAIAYRKEFSIQSLVARDDALETLRELKRRGYVTGLLSNSADEEPNIWPSLDMAAYIDEPLFSFTEGFRKPMSEFYLRALQRLNVEPGECLYVADGDNGELAAAKKIGMEVVMIRPSSLLNDYRQDPEDDWAGPRIERLSDLLSLLK